MTTPHKTRFIWSRFLDQTLALGVLQFNAACVNRFVLTISQKNRSTAGHASFTFLILARSIHHEILQAIDRRFYRRHYFF